MKTDHSWILTPNGMNVAWLWLRCLFLLGSCVQSLTRIDGFSWGGDQSAKGNEPFLVSRIFGSLKTRRHNNKYKNVKNSPIYFFFLFNNFLQIFFLYWLSNSTILRRTLLFSTAKSNNFQRVFISIHCQIQLFSKRLHYFHLPNQKFSMNFYCLQVSSLKFFQQFSNVKPNIF